MTYKVNIQIVRVRVMQINFFRVYETTQEMKLHTKSFFAPVKRYEK